MYYTTLEYYKKLFENRELEYAFKATTLEEYYVWKEALRKRLMEISGITRGVPVESKAKYLQTDEVDGFAAEYYILETEPGIVMPFYLLRPEENGSTIHPVLLIPHGHGGAKRETLSYQKDFIKGALEDGFLVVCPDERGSGDRREFPEQGDEPDKVRGNSHRELLQLGISFGRSVIGTAVWDLMRLTDWLMQLPETSHTLVCAGMSGGGQQVLWFAALDDRVTAAITSGYFYGVKESLIELPQNCACNFVPHFFETADMGELGALIAPRPFFVESGEKDPLSGQSGIANVLPQIEVAKKAYRLFEAEEKLIHSVHSGGHQWVGDGMREFMSGL